MIFNYEENTSTSGVFIMDNGSILANVGSNIRTLRKRKKLTIDELADLADLSGKYLQGVEVGIRNISIKNLNKIVIALETSLQNLVSKSCDNNIDDKKSKILTISKKLKDLDVSKLNIVSSMVENIDMFFQEKNSNGKNYNFANTKK